MSSFSSMDLLRARLADVFEKQQLYYQNYSDSTFRALSDTLAGFATAYQESLSKINFDGLYASIAALQKELSSVNCHAISDSLSASLESLTKHIASELKFPDLPSMHISEKMLDSLQSVSSYVPENQMEIFEEIAKPEPDKKGKMLSAENIRFLVGLIIPIIFALILQYLPDPDTEEIIHNQQIQIEQNEQIIELNTERNELLQNLIELLQESVDVLESGEDTVVELDEEGNVLVDIPNEFQDVTDSDGLDYATDSQD